LRGEHRAVHTGNNYKNKKIDYANKNQIIFKINEKDIIGKYPLLKVIDNENIE